MEHAFWGTDPSGYCGCSDCEALDDPYDKSVGVFEGTRWHMHSEPVCADPECVTYLTRDEMRQAHRRKSK